MIVKQVTFSREDFKNAFELHYTNSYPIRSKLLLILGIILLLIGIILMAAAPTVFPYLKFIFLGLGLFYLAFYFYRKRGILERALKNTGLSGEHTIRLTPTEIQFEGEKGRSTKKYTEITEVANNDTTWLFYFGPNQFYIIPRHLYNQEEILKISEIVEGIQSNQNEV